MLANRGFGVAIKALCVRGSEESKQPSHTPAHEQTRWVLIHHGVMGRPFLPTTQWTAGKTQAIVSARKARVALTWAR